MRKHLEGRGHPQVECNNPPVWPRFIPLATQDYFLNACIECMDVAVQSDPSWRVAALAAKPSGTA